MRPLLGLILFGFLAMARAERNKLKPADFEPLTAVPWTQPGATLKGVLDAIFREPNVSIRYPVLAEYLRIIPERDLGRAFDICLGLEGKQSPDELVAFLLPIWAERDPVGCWEKVKRLFHVVGIEDGWLGYDSWAAKDQPKLTVQDREAIKASPFWLTSEALGSFPAGVERSNAPKAQRLRIMKEFAAMWFDVFGPLWPGGSGTSAYSDRLSNMIAVFQVSTAFSPNELLAGRDGADRAASEILMRRWLVADPRSVLGIVKLARATKWPSENGTIEPVSAGPSTEFLTLWAKLDLQGMILWAESLDLQTDDLAVAARGFLMSRVDAETRDRWLSEARTVDGKETRKPGDSGKARASGLFSTWAKWDPQSALEAAAKAGDAGTVHDAITGATWNSWTPYNMRHCGLGAVKDFPFFQLREEVQRDLASNWSQCVMEEWGDIDIGETARYGLDFMLRVHYAPPESLIAFFSGNDVYPDEGGMIDRTFCALRVWAAVRPSEMKAWIATLQDAGMRKALTWLLEHPWGGTPPASKPPAK